MEIEDVLFMGACALAGVLGFYNGKNTQKKEYETEQRERELLELKKEVMRLKAISLKKQDS